MDNKIREEIKNGKGFTTEFLLEDIELENIRDFIYDQWLYRIQIEKPELASKIFKNKISIEHYHWISDELDHGKVWNKTSRILSNKFASWFLKSNFCKRLSETFGDFIISDEDNLGWPNIYWRLVRPNAEEDIGPLHRDSWFWELNDKFPKPKYKFQRIKVWIPVFCEVGLNGLKLEPHSQKRKDIRWSGELRNGINKPILLTELKEVKPELVNVCQGNPIIFNDNLLHGGAKNFAEKCRVSIEFTMIIKEEE